MAYVSNSIDVTDSQGTPQAQAGTGAPAPDIQSADAQVEMNAPKFQPRPPLRRKLSVRETWRSVCGLTKTFAYLVGHTLGSFEQDPEPASVQISDSVPSGRFDAGTLAISQAISASSIARLEKLEQKATTLLSVIAVVAPITASVAVFIKQQALPVWASNFTLIFDVAGALIVLMAFVAALRALAVRGHQELYLDAVIDRNTDSVRPYSDDFWGRGLLWTAANRQAVCDHIADFVRAAQVFLVVGVVLLVLAAFPVLTVMRDDVQEITGTIRLSSETVDALRGDVAADPAARDRRLASVERELDSLRSGAREKALLEQMAALSAEVAMLRREVGKLRPRQRQPKLGHR